MHFYTLLRYHRKSACEILMCLKSSFLVRTYKSFVEGQNSFRIIWSWVFNCTLCKAVLLILVILLSTVLRVELNHLNLTITKAGIMILTHPPYFWFLKSKGIPRQAEVALGVPGRLRPRIFSTFGTTRVVDCQPNAPAAFTPGEIPGTHFQRLNRPQGTWFCRKKPRKKSQVKPPGIDPGTIRLVSQRLNHYATPGPTLFLINHSFHIGLRFIHPEPGCEVDFRGSPPDGYVIQ